MKKIILVFFVLSVMICISACGSQNQNNSTIQETPKFSISDLPYTSIPTDTYYDNHHKSMYENISSMLMYFSAVNPVEAAANGEEMVEIVLCMDGTGEFRHSYDHYVYEQGSLITENNKAICKYDSGKQVEWDSIDTNDDRTEIDVKILVGDELKKFHCYLYMASDPDDNIIEGYSYEAIHGNTN